MNSTLAGYDGFNICLGSDSYKFSHPDQYPSDVEHVYSYLEARGSSYPGVLSFGQQGNLMRYFVGQVVSNEKIEEARDIIGAHFGNTTLFNAAEEMWKHIVDKHGGMLPLEIKSVPEGTLVPVRNVLMTAVNTCPEHKCRALTNFCETKLMHVWHSMTVATRSYYLKKIILKYLEETGDPSLIDFKLHDFGYRGVSSEESAAMGGAGHLVNFKGTDTMAAILFCRKYYGEPMAGFSIPASEHSTMTAWGEANEADACRNMLDTYPDGLVACVSDQYDIYKLCQNVWGKTLRDKILNRKGTLVVRPDSGDPLEVLPKVFEILGNAFGTEINNKGYQVLNPHIRVIQGDGINETTLPEILEKLKSLKWSADNIAFGSGGGLLQQMDRDTCKMAFKCSAVYRNGIWQDVYKNPVTDSGKTSKRGRLVLRKEGHLFFTEKWTPERAKEDYMRTIFLNGEMVVTDTLAQIRARAWG